MDEKKFEQRESDDPDVVTSYDHSNQRVHETEKETTFRESLLDAIKKNDKSGVAELIADAVKCIYVE